MDRSPVIACCIRLTILQVKVSCWPEDPVQEGPRQVRGGGGGGGAGICGLISIREGHSWASANGVARLEI